MVRQKENYMRPVNENEPRALKMYYCERLDDYQKRGAISERTANGLKLRLAKAVTIFENVSTVLNMCSAKIKHKGK